MRINECYLIGVDTSDNQDQAVLQVVRCKGDHKEVVKTLYGSEAINLYFGITNTSNEKEQNNESF